MVASAAAGATVASAAIQLSLVHPVIVRSKCMPSPTAGGDQSAVDVVENFKEQLQQLTLEENGLAVESIIKKLETLPLTREILEITRIGGTVNEIRKRSASSWPEVSRRCRGLIKTWQKVAEVSGPLSSCDGSSNGGTPSLVSPALGGARRGLTPKTPSFKTQPKVSSTGLQYSSFPSSETSPSIASIRNGSYAPHSSVANVVHQSSSVGTTLYAFNSDDAKGGRSGGGVTPNDVESQFSLDSLPPNGSEASSFSVGSARQHGERTPIPTITLKRTKAADNLSLKLKAGSKSGSGSPPITYRAVSAARRNVQSTAQLVAQMSESLPEYIPAWDIALDIIPAPPASAKGEPLDVSTATNRQRIPVGEQSPHQLSDTVADVSSMVNQPEKLPAGEEVPKVKASKEARREKKRLRAERKEMKEQKKAARLAKKKRRPTTPEFESSHSVTGEALSAVVSSANELTDGFATASNGLEAKGVDVPVMIDLTAEGEEEEMPSLQVAATVMEEGPSLWFDHLLTPDSMRKLKAEERSEEKDDDISPDTSPTTDRNCLSVVATNGRKRNLVILPYLDLGTPDFTEHPVPDPSRFIAQRRFPSKHR